MPTNIKIAIVHDNLLFRQTLKDTLEYGNNFEIIFQTDNSSELQNFLLRDSIDVILFELNKSYKSHLILDILTSMPNTKIIVFSNSNNSKVHNKIMKNGAHSFLTKNCGIEELIDGVYGVLEDSGALAFKSELYIPEISLNKNSINLEINKSLSKREIEILKLICQEKCSLEISQNLNLSRRTIENHRYKISKKIGASHVIGMFVYSLQNGIAEITADGKVAFA